MGLVRKPDRKKDELLKDLSPGVRRAVEILMEQHQGDDLQKRLSTIIGINKARRLVKDLR